MRAVQAGREVRNNRNTYQDPLEKIQTVMQEAYTTPISVVKDVKAFVKYADYTQKDLNKLIQYLKSLRLGPSTDLIPLVGDPSNGNFKIRHAKGDAALVKKIENWVKENVPPLVKYMGFGQGSPKIGTPDPKGADWESLITDKYNNLVGGNDPEASQHAQTFYPDYDEAAEKVAKSFNKQLKMTTPMTQYGGGGGRSNLSAGWIDHGGTNGTPKTDMYTKQYNISLKKKGGSQLASGGKGETIATFYAALEYLGEDRSSAKEIDKIMSMIEKNFAKIKNRQLTAGTATKIIAGKKKVDLTPKLKGDLELFSTTEAFHKELNAEITKNLNFEKKPDFLKWYCFEAMSGYKKFSNTTSIASICVEFDAKTGAISKAIPVTSDGKASGLSGIPTASKEVQSISSKMKVFAAWKTGDGSPASVLRVFPETNSFKGIILNELYNDKVANKVMVDLHEEILQGDEFFLIENIFNKIKEFTPKAKNWLNNIYKKIVMKVKAALDNIKKLGAKLFEKLFEFFNIAIDAVKESFPKDLYGFVYGMVE